MQVQAASRPKRWSEGSKEIGEIRPRRSAQVLVHPEAPRPEQSRNGPEVVQHDVER
jgi:hypothetical protein